MHMNVTQVGSMARGSKLTICRITSSQGVALRGLSVLDPTMATIFAVTSLEKTRLSSL